MGLLSVSCPSLEEDLLFLILGEGFVERTKSSPQFRAVDGARDDIRREEFFMWGV